MYVKCLTLCYLINILNSATSYVLLAANIDDFRSIAKRFVPDKMADDIFALAKESNLRDKVDRSGEFYDKRKRPEISQQSYEEEPIKKRGHRNRSYKNKRSKKTTTSKYDLNLDEIVEQVKQRLQKELTLMLSSPNQHRTTPDLDDLYSTKIPKKKKPTEYAVHNPKSINKYPSRYIKESKLSSADVHQEKEREVGHERYVEPQIKDNKYVAEIFVAPPPKYIKKHENNDPPAQKFQPEIPDMEPQKFQPERDQEDTRQYTNQQQMPIFSQEESQPQKYQQDRDKKYINKNHKQKTQQQKYSDQTEFESSPHRYQTEQHNDGSPHKYRDPERHDVLPYKYKDSEDRQVIQPQKHRDQDRHSVQPQKYKHYQEKQVQPHRYSDAEDSVSPKYGDEDAQAASPLKYFEEQENVPTEEPKQVSRPKRMENHQRERKKNKKLIMAASPGVVGEFFQGVDLLNYNDSYEDYVTPKKDDDYASEDDKKSHTAPDMFSGLRQPNQDSQKILDMFGLGDNNDNYDKKKKIRNPNIKNNEKRNPNNEPTIRSPKIGGGDSRESPDLRIRPYAEQIMSKDDDYEEPPTITTEETKARTERIQFEERGPIREVAHNRTRDKAKKITRMTVIPKRDFYKMSSPNYVAKLPIIAEKYKFDEPIPEKDREPENLKPVGNPPASINGKVRLL